MIKFFRKFRQRMLIENKIGKYLLYASGEIILVVIGILIALQLNNWKEESKEKILEISTLSELNSSFREDLNDINFNLNFNKKGLYACEQLISAFDQGLPYHDSLDRHFGQFYIISVFVNNTGAYETLKSRGLDIISNDSLRRQVQLMYDIIYSEILENQRNFNYIDLEQNKIFMIENMTNWKLFESAKPRNYDEISKDTVFHSRLAYTAQVRNISISRYSRAKKECESVLNKLELEIERLSN
jgi:hypothetical protein